MLAVGACGATVSWLGLTLACCAGDWGHVAAASRLCGELGLVSTHEQLVSDQIRNGLTRYESWVDVGHECLVPIDLDVTVGRLRYRDRIMWDANEPPNKAGADEFAYGVCTDLGLGYGGTPLLRRTRRAYRVPALLAGPILPLPLPPR